MPTRRDLLQLGGGALLGAGLLAGGEALAGSSPPARRFDGDHEQPGIIGRQPRHLALATINLSTELRGAEGRRELATLLQDWTAAARLLMAGEPLSGELGPQPDLAAPPDTGEAAGLDPAGLTLTFGFGERLLDPARGLIDAARSGWGARSNDLAAQLAPIPPMRGDALQARWSAGDVVLLAAADDAQVAAHAVRAMLRVGRGAVALASLQRGFLPESGSGTPRNLFGFKDGTGNPGVHDPAIAQRMLWTGEEGPAWLRGGGTYLVVRRIAMDLALWDATSTEKQEATFGRERGSGAPVGGRDEFDPPDLRATGSDGAPLIDPRSHVGLAHAAAQGGQQILRRPWSYLEGEPTSNGDLDAGLLFLAFQRSVTGQFVPLQRTLAEGDLLTEYVHAVGSSVYAVPPAPRGPRDWLARTLLVR